MVKIRRIPNGFIIKHNGIETIFPGNEIIYENEAKSFRGLSLCNLDISHSNLDDADLRGADFSGTKLDCSTIRNAQLGGARFLHADMLGCDLSGSYLDDADFSHASLNFADFSDCDLSLACFDGAHLELSFYNVKTVWPAGMDPDVLKSRRRDLWEQLNIERQQEYERKKKDNSK